MATEKTAATIQPFLKYITFGLGDEEFGIPIEEAREIIANYEIVNIPKAPEFVEGMISLRGEIIPIVEMRKRFEMPQREEGEETRVIVLEMKNLSVGIQVDKVHEVLKLAESDVGPPPKLVAGLDAYYLKGVAERDGKLTIILNVEEIFSTSEKIVIKEGLKEAAV